MPVKHRSYADDEEIFMRDIGRYWATRQNTFKALRGFPHGEYENWVGQERKTQSKEASAILAKFDERWQKAKIDSKAEGQRLQAAYDMNKATYEQYPHQKRKTRKEEEDLLAKQNKSGGELIAFKKGAEAGLEKVFAQIRRETMLKFHKHLKKEDWKLVEEVRDATDGFTSLDATQRLNSALRYQTGSAGARTNWGHKFKSWPPPLSAKLKTEQPYSSHLYHRRLKNRAKRVKQWEHQARERHHVNRERSSYHAIQKAEDLATMTSDYQKEFSEHLSSKGYPPYRPKGFWKVQDDGKHGIPRPENHPAENPFKPKKNIFLHIRASNIDSNRDHAARSIVRHLRKLSSKQQRSGIERYHGIDDAFKSLSQQDEVTPAGIFARDPKHEDYRHSRITYLTPWTKDLYNMPVVANNFPVKEHIKNVLRNANFPTNETQLQRQFLLNLGKEIRKSKNETQRTQELYKWLKYHHTTGLAGGRTSEDFKDLPIGREGTRLGAWADGIKGRIKSARLPADIDDRFQWMFDRYRGFKPIARHIGYTDYQRQKPKPKRKPKPPPTESESEIPESDVEPLSSVQARVRREKAEDEAPIRGGAVRRVGGGYCAAATGSSGRSEEKEEEAEV